MLSSPDELTALRLEVAWQRLQLPTLRRKLYLPVFLRSIHSGFPATRIENGILSGGGLFRIEFRAE
jgi:hypothetical protein